MCAISGIINHQSDPALARTVIEKMNAAQAHRGPDDSGVFVDQNAALGHRRLSIIDLATGAQPISNEDGSIVVVCNGEIYNYRELRDQLVSRGHRFKSRSDSEVLAHLYEEMGNESIAMLDGMFALAIYDSRRRRVLLARDRMGQKPLCYFMNRHTLVFASELSGLKQHPNMPRELDPGAVRDFMSFQYIPGPETVFTGVQKLLPGHQMEFRIPERTLSIRTYWKVDYSKKLDLGFDEAAVQLRALVDKAVEKRLMSDVPLGTFLSGGLDSAIVTSLVSAKLGSGCAAYTIGFENAAYDERDGAEATAAEIRSRGGKIEHRQKVIDPCDLSLLEELVSHFGEPYADASMLPTALLSEFAREGIKVALSGDGADEIFCGYERYIAMRMAARCDAMPFGSLLAGVASKLIPDRGERTLFGRTRRFARACASPLERRYFEMVNRCPAAAEAGLLGERWSGVPRRDPAEKFKNRFWELSSPDAVEKLAELDLGLYLADDILPKVDIASMRSALEVRSPFFDREVVEFAARLPLEYKLLGNQRKRILHAAFSDIITPRMAKLRKRGFGVPVSAWLRGAWRAPARETMLSGELTRDGWFAAPAVEKLWEEHCSGRRDHGYLLWSMLILGIFLKQNKRG